MAIDLLLGNLKKLLCVMYSIIQQAKANKKQCRLLGKRFRNIGASTEAVKPAPECEGALADVVELIKEATVFMRKFAKKGWMSRCATSTRDRNKFSELDHDATTLGNDLKLGLAVRSLLCPYPMYPP